MERGMPRSNEENNCRYEFIGIGRLEQLAKLAFYDVCVEEGVNIAEGELERYESYKTGMSEFEAQAVELLRKQVHNGMALEKALIE